MARSVQEEFNRRISFLQGITHDDAAPRLAGVLEWLESEPATHKIITALRQAVDIEELLASREHEMQPPQTKNPEEVARVGLYVLELCKHDPQKLYQLLVDFGCYETYGDLNTALYNLDSKFLEPFMRYISSELRDAPQELTIADAIEYRREMLLDPTFDEQFPETSRLFSNLSKEMSAFTDSENWFNIANSCRELLKEFTSELVSVAHIELPADIQAADFRSIARHILSKRMRKSKRRDTLIVLSASLWNYIQVLIHRRATDRSEAMRAYLWTGLVVSEVYDQIRSK